MTPQAGVALQIERYRAMQPVEQVDVALQLHELACERARLGIRRQHPHADEAEVNRLLRQRPELARPL